MPRLLPPPTDGLGAQGEAVRVVSWETSRGRPTRGEVDAPRPLPGLGAACALPGARPALTPTSYLEEAAAWHGDGHRAQSRLGSLPVSVVWGPTPLPRAPEEQNDKQALVF